MVAFVQAPRLHIYHHKISIKLAYHHSKITLLFCADSGAIWLFKSLQTGRLPPLKDAHGEYPKRKSESEGMEIGIETELTFELLL